MNTFWLRPMRKNACSSSKSSRSKVTDSQLGELESDWPLHCQSVTMTCLISNNLSWTPILFIFFIQDRDYLSAMECIKGTGSVESTQHVDTHAAGEQASCHILTSSPGNIALTFQERQRQPSGAVWNGGMSMISRHTHTQTSVVDSGVWNGDRTAISS